MTESLEVRLARDPWVLEDRLDLAPESERLAVRPVVERLLADPVPGHEELLLLLVPDREGEHAAEALDAALAHLLVEVDDRLGVRARVEAVALLLELFFERLEVVDLAVEDDPDGAVLVRE